MEQNGSYSAKKHTVKLATKTSIHRQKTGCKKWHALPVKA